MGIPVCQVALPSIPQTNGRLLCLTALNELVPKGGIKIGIVQLEAVGIRTLCAEACKYSHSQGSSGNQTEQFPNGLLW